MTTTRCSATPNVSRRLFMGLMSAAPAGLLVTGTGPGSPMAHAEAAPPTAADLADSTPDGPRWLSIPSSRIVVNPYDILSTATPAEQSDRHQLPLNAAYYVQDEAPRLDDMLMVTRKPAGTPPGYAVSSAGFVDAFTGSTSAWSASSNITQKVSASLLSITIRNTTGTHYGSVSRTITVDVDKYPQLRISVPRATHSWNVKVNSGSAATDTVLQTTTEAEGVFTYDLKAKTGWSGTKTFALKIFTVGYSSTTDVDEVSVRTVPSTPTAFEDDFSGSTLDPGWKASSVASASVGSGKLTLTVPQATGTHYGILTRTVVANLDTYPILTVRVDRADNYWAIKVNTGSGSDIIVQNNTGQLGVFSFDLKKITGWTGTKAVQIKLFANGHQAPVVIDRISLQAPTKPWLLSAQNRQTTWMPHRQEISASFAEGTGMKVADTFHDVDSLHRRITVASAPAGSSTLLSGSYFGTPSVDAARAVLTFAQDGFHSSIALPSGATDIRFYADRDAWSRGGPTLSTPDPTGGVWSAVLPSDRAQHDVGVGFAVGEGADAAATSVSRGIDAAGSDFEADATRQADYFSAVMGRAPHPEDFTIHAVDPQGVDAAQVRIMYYRAWTFAASSVLPPTPEVGNPYPQVATGKPALYLHGPDGAEATASWDSVIGMQLLGHVEPDLAWGALTGMLALVEEDGLLPGEYLPAREAQTAWLLWKLTGDVEKLEAIYPDLRRLLLYRQKVPVYGGEPNQNYKDLAFVSHALVDTEYARQLAEQLGETADVAMWKDTYGQLEDDMFSWFWATPRSEPPQKFDPTNGTSLAGRVMSATPALHVPSVRGDYASGLLARFDSLYDPEAPLAGFGKATNDVRYGITSYTIYGLLEAGYTERADVLSNAILRDIVKSNMFAERYEWDETGPYPAGQRPSLFGTGALVDAVWLNNGYRIDQGSPAL